jgi:hypothetical protein
MFLKFSTFLQIIYLVLKLQRCLQYGVTLLWMRPFLLIKETQLAKLQTLPCSFCERCACEFRPFQTCIYCSFKHHTISDKGHCIMLLGTCYHKWTNEEMNTTSKTHSQWNECLGVLPAAWIKKVDKSSTKESPIYCIIFTNWILRFLGIYLFMLVVAVIFGMYLT